MNRCARIQTADLKARFRRNRMLVFDNCNGAGILTDPEMRDVLYGMRLDPEISSKFDVHVDNQIRASLLIIDGWYAKSAELNFIKRARHEIPGTPIAVLGYNCTESDRIGAYEAGIDDFIESPCSSRELEIRLRRLINRNTLNQSALSIYDLQLWEDARVLIRGGRLVKLSLKELEILLYLARNSPNPVSRENILREVFGLNFEPGTNVVEVHMHRLRDKIDRGHNHTLLNTVRGIGYRLGGQEPGERVNQNGRELT